MKYLLLIFILLISINSNAAIYVQENKNTTAYSDTPLENAQTINVAEPSTSSEAPPTTQNLTPQTKIPETKTEQQIYTTFIISSPTDQQTFQNQPIIPVDIKIEPTLQKGDKIQLYVDGKPWKEALESTHFELSQLDRGTHQLSAKLIGANQIELKQTNAITIFIHQNHV